MLGNCKLLIKCKVKCSWQMKNMIIKIGKSMSYNKLKISTNKNLKK